MTAAAAASLFPAESDEAVGARTEELARLLTGHRFRFCNERDLQDGMAEVLKRHGWAFDREFVLSGPDRPDFWIDPGIAVEAKIKGSLSEALRQVHRYAQHDRVRAILLVGTPYWLGRLPPEVAGKPLYGARLVSSLL